MERRRLYRPRGNRRRTQTLYRDEPEAHDRLATLIEQDRNRAALSPLVRDELAANMDGADTSGQKRDAVRRTLATLRQRMDAATQAGLPTDAASRRDAGILEARAQRYFALNAHGIATSTAEQALVDLVRRQGRFMRRNPALGIPVRVETFLRQLLYADPVFQRAYDAAERESYEHHSGRLHGEGEGSGGEGEEGGD